MTSTKMEATVWFSVDGLPLQRSVYGDGHDWFVLDMDNRKLVPIDSASGWVLDWGENGV